MKRVGARGEGQWQRMEWDEITEEIADKIIDISARLIVNRAALKTDPRVAQLVETFRANAERVAA